MIKLKIKKGDNVKVITGDDKGKTGNVIKVFPDIRKVLVKGINEKKKKRKNKRINGKLDCKRESKKNFIYFLSFPCIYF